MTFKTLPDGQMAVCYELKPYGDGRYIFEAFGFKSIPFDLKNMRQNKEWFRETIQGQVEGTVQ